MVVQAGPVGVADLDPQVALEGRREIPRQDQPVALGEQHVLEILDLLDARPLHLEVADLGFLEQVDLDLAVGLVVRPPPRPSPARAS